MYTYTHIQKIFPATRSVDKRSGLSDKKLQPKVCLAGYDIKKKSRKNLEKKKIDQKRPHLKLHPCIYSKERNVDDDDGDFEYVLREFIIIFYSFIILFFIIFYGNFFFSFFYSCNLVLLYAEEGLILK